MALPSSSLFDLVIIGSGPAALAVVTRILESRPAALYTEEEHAHLHWLKRSSISRPLMKVKRTGRGQEKILNGSKTKSPVITPCNCEGVIRILVIDRLGRWLANWNRLFKAYEISHLRSPMFFHPAPSDVDALVAYAERNGRTRCGNESPPRRFTKFQQEQVKEEVDLLEITGCVGKEVSKHKIKQERKGKGAWSPSSHSQPFGPAVNERNRRDYFTPSTTLFHDFIEEDLVKRYGLDNNGKPWLSASEAVKEIEEDAELKRVTLIKGEVEEMTYKDDLHIQGWDLTSAFEIKLSCGTVFGAKAVVCAMGPGASPNVPSFLSGDTTDTTKMSGPGWCHSTVLGGSDASLPPRVLLDKEKRGVSTTLVVIGGGLTSAQICDVAIRKGVSKVILVMRGYMKVKPFDFGLEWIGQYGNLEHMRFWQEKDLEKRKEMMFSARNGGSITPRYSKLIKKYQEQGRLIILENTSVERAEWHESHEAGAWILKMITKVKSSDEIKETEMKADYIIAATGAAPLFSKVPFLSTIAKRENVKEYGGLPALSEGLQYGNIPLFCTGAFSALQIGPGAFNLFGMRAAADRIAIRLQEMALGGITTTLQSEEGGKKTYEKPSNYTHYSFEVLQVEA